MPARTLTSVLDEAGIDRVDVLSLDVEGYEHEVLAGLDLNRFMPRLMLLECSGESDLARYRRIRQHYRIREWPSPNDVLFERLDPPD